MRLVSTPFLRPQAELDAGGDSSSGSSSSRAVTAMAAAGLLLAVGCSDGSTQLWRRAGLAEFAQHALLPPPPQQPVSEGAVVSCLAFSGDASLLAVAAGSAVSICCTASGHVLGQRDLSAPPVFLYWGPKDALLALLPSGELQRLGAPEVQPPTRQPSHAPRAALAAGGQQLPQPQLELQQAVRQLPSRKKAVRFAESAAATDLHPLPAPAALLHLRPPGGNRAALPQLPSHPLLAQGSVGGLGLSADPGCWSTGAGSGSVDRNSSVLAPPAARQQLYPVLDQQALRGVQPAAADSGRRPPAAAAACDQPSAPAKLHVTPGEAATTRSVCHAGTSVDPGSLPASGAWQWMPHQRSQDAAAQLDAPAEAAPAQAAVANGEAPRPLRLPKPTQRPRSPPRVSKQHCSACQVLAPDQPAASVLNRGGGSRPVSPAKAAMLEQLGQLRCEATASQAEGAGGSRPASPVKLGAACTLQAQEEAGELQPPEARPFTGEQCGVVWVGGR